MPKCHNGIVFKNPYSISSITTNAFFLSCAIIPASSIKRQISALKLVFLYKHAKVFTICVPVQKVPVARLAKSPKTEFTLVNGYFGG
jgi:hypothetical protein